MNTSFKKLNEKEHNLVQTIWDILLETSDLSMQGKIDAKPNIISVGDLKVFLMAVFSIKGNKRLGCQPENLDTSE